MTPRDTRHTAIVLYNVFQWKRILRKSDADFAERLDISIEEFRQRMLGVEAFTPAELERIAEIVGQKIPGFTVEDLSKLPEDAERPSATILRFPKS